MAAPDQEYFDWLISQIRTPNGKVYFNLFERMHNLEFVWTVANDDNRIQDALDIRSEFLPVRKRRTGGVTILEVLIALSRRAAFDGGGEPEIWAWQLIKNLKLNKAHDPWTAQKTQSVDEILEALVWRTYSHDGRGGFFPLQYPQEDQTKVEIWYQMHAYLLEIQEV